MEELSTARRQNTPSPHGWDRWTAQGAFYAGFLAYVWFLIQPRLIYDAFGIYLPYPEFALDWEFLRQALTRPGGVVEYVAAFLSQWFFASAIGALIVTATAGLIGFGTERLMREMGGRGRRGGVEARHGWFLSLLPALAVLILYQMYCHPLAALLALAICLWVAVAYQQMTSPWRLVAFLAMCVGLYFLAGAVCLLFGLLAGIWHVSARRGVIAGAGVIVAGALVPWAGTQLAHMTVVEAYSVAWPFGAGIESEMESWPLHVLRGLFLFPLGMLLVVAVCRFLPRVPQDRCLGFTWYGARTLRVTSELVVLTAAFAAVHQFARAPHREVRFKLVHFARQRQWDEVLRAAGRLPPSGHDCFCRHLVNRALFHTGRLGDDLFSFSQDQAGLLLLTGDVPHGPPKFWMLSEIAWELGDLNLAEQWAFERLEAVGECPSALELLAQVCLAKERTDAPTFVGRPFEAGRTASKGRPTTESGREAARVLLNRMKKNVIHGRRARTLLDLLEGTPPAGDPWLQEIAGVRALRGTDDRVFQTYSEELMLESLLRANPRNKMAFEYLMAFYLVVRRTDKLVDQLHRLDDFRYREIPRHYEEAILIHANETGQTVALPGRKIRVETLQRFEAFIARVRPWQDQPQLAVGALADEFGDSYFYYYAFGMSGRGGTRRTPDRQDPLAGDSGRGDSMTGRPRRSPHSQPPLAHASGFEAARPASRPARIQPDYRGLVVPPNIAPLNFRIEEPGEWFFVRIRSLRGTPVEIFSRSGEIEIPRDAWRRLLAENRGSTLWIDVYSRTGEGDWRRYESWTNQIAAEDIDSHIAYRRLKPDALYYRNIGIYQRCLETFEESAVLDGRWFQGGCVNCHAFQNHDPSRLSLHFRGRYGDAALFVHDGRVHTVETRLGHAAWHPSGKVVAFSRFDIQMFYHTARTQTRDAIDSDSLLGYYRLDRRQLKTSPPLADKDWMETQPAWSPDGRYLYFASAPKLWAETGTFPAEHYAKVRYDLKRVPYDVESDEWGAVETILSAERTGKSNVNPRPSPDGRFLLFGMCNYGGFALYQPESDLYLLDLESGQYSKLECNSPFAESWHGWSSNGRWIVFSSKRPTGIFTRLYLCHVDKQGHASKPFILPQRDPSYYDDLLSLYNLPEFILGPVATSPAAMLEAVRDTQRVQVDGITGASTKLPFPEPRRLGQE